MAAAAALAALWTGGFGTPDAIAATLARATPLLLTGVAVQVALVARLGVEQVDWVGTSMGGIIGMLAAAQDHEIGRYLRSTARRVLLAVNKAEGMSESPLLGEFHELGIGEPHPVSAAHGQGIRSLLDAVLEGFPPEMVEAMRAQYELSVKPLREGAGVMHMVVVDGVPA